MGWEDQELVEESEVFHSQEEGAIASCYRRHGFHMQHTSFQKV